MECNSKERERLPKGKKGKQCQETATKQCKHGFATCKKHKHWCKNEECLPL